MQNTNPTPPIAQTPDLALTDQALSTDSDTLSPKHGACVQFLGIVRDSEDGRKLSGIDYRAYPPMAEATLAEIARTGAEEFGEHTLKLHHRVGFVPIAEASVIIRVTTRHSQAAFDICRNYLHRLKTEVPIWKHPVFADQAVSTDQSGSNHP